MDQHKKNVDLELVKQIGKIFNSNFPERLHKVYVYPSGVIFRTIWKIAQVFFDKETRDKVIPLKNQSELLKHIDASQLPVCLGGSDSWEFNVDEL